MQFFVQPEVAGRRLFIGENDDPVAAVQPAGGKVDGDPFGAAAAQGGNENGDDADFPAFRRGRRRGGGFVRENVPLR